ncbi:hypothetical protein H5410_028465 [Solanum commersonii]|uniref:Uncharacterized protein n=1 Tax=Solanum commersonii TaxID=4109 RepID=A0A9J5Z439_SOLCO|nr:hypothetical protein H5410_028465 [Solanum commersonii]
MADWADLPIDLLALIENRVEELTDFILVANSGFSKFQGQPAYRSPLSKELDDRVKVGFNVDRVLFLVGDWSQMGGEGRQYMFSVDN